MMAEWLNAWPKVSIWRYVIIGSRALLKSAGRWWAGLGVRVPLPPHINSLLKNRVTSNSYGIATEKFRRFESYPRKKIYEVSKWLKVAIIIFTLFKYYMNFNI